MTVKDEEYWLREGQVHLSRQAALVVAEAFRYILSIPEHAENLDGIVGDTMQKVVDDIDNQLSD